MRKYLLVTFALSFIIHCLHAQTVTINPAPLSTTQLNGLGSSNYHVSEYIYTDAEIGNTNFTTAGTAINQINLNMTATSDKPAQVFSNVKIYLKEVSAATTGFSAGTYSTAGYTEVYNGTFPATTVGWMGVNLTTPFIRTSGSNLQMMIERTDNVVPFTATAPPTWQATTGVATGSRRYNGTVALSGTTALSTSSFRVVVQFRHAVANDASLNSFTSIGKLPVGYGSTSPVVASVTNTGTGSLTNVPVTLTVTGANTYTGNKTIASLAPGATTTVTFDGYVPTSAGSNTLSVSLGADGDNTNNSAASQTQITTTNVFALSNNDAFTPSGSIGFGTGSGTLLIKMPVYKNASLTSIRVSISADAAVAGNTVYGVLLSAAGAMIAQTPNYIVQNADLGQYVTFTFAAPQAVTAGTTYYIGLAQTANATAYYPVNTQSTKPNLAHSTVLAGGTITDYTTFGSLMIEGQFATAFPVEISSFTGSRQGITNLLKWTTATENNNKGFDLERSADGIKFSSIGFITTKADGGNSTSSLNYSFIDEKSLVGTNYYRLKEVDKDGKATYSSIVTLKGEKVAFEISALYPNPAKDEMTIAIVSSKKENITISITDLTGKEVKRFNSTIAGGDNNISVNVSALATGTYYLRLISGTETKTTKFIKN
jgi:hypothetical protein